ncbi:DUF1616 domain-containing protein [Halorussus salinisoli]|uniref:DUF1616 domain-containing protein n=1 Tax=Halorussus salinisoli TaxID=2558242 RepID=UPI0010C1E3FC|nr:DUF1616 domain-containing protein [Halorussus salinisoli]
MESRAARGYLDLLVALGWLALAAAVTALSLDGIVRLVLLAPTTVFVPGYALVSLVYPTAGSPPDGSTIGPTGTGLRKAFSRGNHAIGGVERIALAVVWSFVIVPSVALGVHFSPFPIETQPIQIGVFGVTFVLLVGAFVSRARQSADERFAPTVPSLPGVSGRSSGLGHSSSGLGTSTASAGRSWSQALLVVSLLVLASSVGYALVAPPANDGFTELYVQSGDVSNETTSLYPSTLVRGETQPFEFGVTNREGSSVEYSYVVAFQRIDRPDSATGSAGTNQSGSGNSSVEVIAQTEVDRGEFELADGETRNVTARVTPQTTGDDLRVVALVYRGDPPSDPSVENAYRSLRLPVDVTASDGSGTNDSALGAPRGDR